MIDVSELELGDDITIAGKVSLLYSKTHILIECNSGEEVCIPIKDIKTHRPKMKEV